MVPYIVHSLSDKGSIGLWLKKGIGNRRPFGTQRERDFLKETFERNTKKLPVVGLFIYSLPVKQT